MDVGIHATGSLLRNVKGQNRQEMIRDYYAAGKLNELHGQRRKSFEARVDFPEKSKHSAHQLTIGCMSYNRYQMALYPIALMIWIVILLTSAASALAAPITLELSAGSVIKGDLVSWNGQQAVITAEFGSMTLKRDQLTQATLQKLELLLSGGPQKLLERISELEATVESLRRDNAALRQQLQIATAAQSFVVGGAAQRQRADLPSQFLDFERLSSG